MDKEYVKQQLIGKNLLRNVKNIQFKELGGGVSSDIFLVSDGETKLVVKQALEKLRVKDDWYSDTARNRTEYRFMEYVNGFMPGSVPRLLYVNHEEKFFVMEYLGEDLFNWKQELLNGRFYSNITQNAAECLARLHLHARNDPQVKDIFPENDQFESLRVEPYLVTTGRRHPALEHYFQEESENLLQRKITLIHGDYSPKNMMVSEHRFVLLDHEVACIGDPVFDVAFILTHLLLKKLYHCKDRTPWPDLAEVFLEHYFAKSNTEKPEISHTRIGRLVLLLLLARVDGKSPVEYLNEEQKEFIREFVIEMLQRKNNTFNKMNSTWDDQIRKRFK